MQPLLPGKDFTSEIVLPGNPKQWAGQGEANPGETMATEQPWQMQSSVGGGSNQYRGSKRGHIDGTGDQMETQRLLDVDDHNDGNDSDSAMV